MWYEFTIRIFSLDARLQGELGSQEVDLTDKAGPIASLDQSLGCPFLWILHLMSPWILESKASILEVIVCWRWV